METIQYVDETSIKMGVRLILEIGVGELETWQENDANISMRLGNIWIS